jgi:hypothetical protein
MVLLVQKEVEAIQHKLICINQTGYPLAESRASAFRFRNPGKLFGAFRL